ncbi:23S rRNA (guanosine-2'-O-)-methyltransferase RlmB [Candidatus Hamiltonella defensa (Bemisia tabaci)]|nr:23S rRNA (guanosine-2'-O-)-methyltransferase RlmB [Candidatus Hamiltonella defensa (Bemisia tabaci)]
MMSDIIYGFHSIKAFLEHHPERFLEIFVLQNNDSYRLQSLVKELKSAGLSILFTSRQYLDVQTGGGVHQGIMAKVGSAHQYQENELPALLNSLDTPFVLVLDGITDPHNLGACLRSAEASGVQIVILPRDRSAPLNATVKKAASGAAENIPVIRVTNLARTLRVLKEYHLLIIGTAGEAKKTLYEARMTGSMALVMGSEEKGLRRLTREHCDHLIRIPMLGRVSSLNVSVATGICLFEAVRQRNMTKI